MTTKERAERILANLGLTPSAAVELFFAAVVRENGVPFEVRLAKEEEEKEV